MKIEELYLIPEAIEAAVRAVLKARIKLPVFVTGDTDGKGAPWLEVDCELGAAFPGESPHLLPDSTGLYREAAFEGTLRVRVVSRRDATQPRPFEGHSKARAKIQAVMAPDQGYFGEDVLPHHQMPRATFAGAPFGHRDEDHCDVTEMSWSVLLGIRAEAMAEATP